MNDETRTTNDEGNPNETNEKKYRPRPAPAFVLSHLVINATFAIRGFIFERPIAWQHQVIVEASLRKRVARFLVLYA